MWLEEVEVEELQVARFWLLNSHGFK